MKPASPAVLNAVAMAIGGRILSLTDEFAQTELGISTGLTLMLASEYDRAVAWRVEELTELRELLDRADAALNELPDDVRGAITLVLASPPPRSGNLAVSALDEQLDTTRSAVDALHCHLDRCHPDATPGASQWLDDVWATLRSSVERRVRAMPPIDLG